VNVYTGTLTANRSINCSDMPNPIVKGGTIVSMP